MRLRQVTCAVCHNGSHNQYGHRSTTIPFDDIAQSERWPTLFIHHSCATELTRALMSTFGLDASHPFIAEFYEPHQHERF